MVQKMVQTMNQNDQQYDVYMYVCMYVYRCIHILTSHPLHVIPQNVSKSFVLRQMIPFPKHQYIVVVIDLYDHSNVLLVKEHLVSHNKDFVFV